jgi:predicted Fe-Mo cluster-binding NifX family protein
MTRVCVPTNGPGGLDDLVGEHFGRVPTYTIFDPETGQVEIVDNTSEHMGGTGYPAEILANLGIDVLLCSGLGRRAIQMLGEGGVEVSIGASGTARQAIDAWKAGDLARAAEGDACTQHAFHDHH